jgi:hypothetical protein
LGSLKESAVGLVSRLACALTSGVGTAGANVARLAAAAVALVIVGGSELYAQETPVGVPDILQVNDILTQVKTSLTGIVGPLVFFSIGVMICMLIWRSARKFAGGGA